MATATLQTFNVFLTERLTAAAVDIFGFVEKTLVEYQDEVYRTKQENQRLQRLLDLVYKPEIRLHRADSGQTALPTSSKVISIHVQPSKQEWIPSVGQEEPGLLPIKEEKVDLWTRPVEEGSSPECSNERDNLTEVITTGRHAENKTPSERDDDPVPSSVEVPNCEKKKNIYHCAICSEQFLEKADLSCHLKAHSRNKSVSCHICGKTTKSKNYMKRHMKAHSEDKPYVCPICGNKYKLKGHIKEHIRTHTGERPYSCYICGKRFNRCTTMSKHARIRHKENNPYKCLHCSQRFPLLVSFKQHMKSTHGITMSI